MIDVPSSVQDMPLIVVGIGASAGGLDSLERLFRSLPSQPWVAIVIAQHRPPNHESLREELLRRFSEVTIKPTHEK